MENQSSFYLCNHFYELFSQEKNISALRTLKEIVKTCIGPCGKLKVIRNSSSQHTTITSSSLRLFPVISVKNSFLKIIVSASKTHTNIHRDGSLKCVFFTISLIEKAFICDISYPLLATLYEYFSKVVSNFLLVNNNVDSWKVDFLNLRPLQCIVKTILSSKPGCLLAQSQKDHICNLLLQAFLKVMPTSSLMPDNLNIRLLTSEGQDVQESKLFEGLLIKINKSNLVMMSKHKFGVAKVILFGISLSGDVDLPANKFIAPHSFSVSEAILKHLRSIIQKIISEQANMVFCQKVVHPSLKKLLNDSGIAVFDQLGSEIAEHLQYILGGNVISSLFMPLSFCIINSTQEKINENCYVLLKSESTPFCSLLISNYNEESLTELKVVCLQAIGALFRLIKDSTVCCGAGCTEINLALRVIKQVNTDLNGIATSFGCSQAKVLQALHAFVISLTDVAVSSHQRSKISFATESTFGHLWKLNDGSFPSKQDTCACGLLTASDGRISNWHFLSDLELIFKDFKESVSVNQEWPHRNLILDLSSTKLSTLIRGTETAAMVLKTDKCIMCGPVVNSN